MPEKILLLGYPSLLKQQLRDLVLRRKSLVREEPEDESVAEAHRQAALFAQAHQQNNQLKTGKDQNTNFYRINAKCAFRFGLRRFHVKTSVFMRHK